MLPSPRGRGGTVCPFASTSAPSPRSLRSVPSEAVRLLSMEQNRTGSARRGYGVAERLLHAIAEALAEAGEGAGGEATDSAEISATALEGIERTLEAAAWLVVLSEAGWLDRLPDVDRATLLERTPAAIRQARATALSDVEERESWLRCALLAEAGLRRLRHENLDYAELPADTLEPSPRRVRRTLAGELDGFSGASCANGLAQRGSGELAWLAETILEAEQRPYRFVADPEKPIRDPDEGRRIDTIDDLEIDVVWFETDGQLALYAATPAPLSVKSEHGTTIDNKRGYWIGQFQCPLDAIEIELRLGDDVRSWRPPLKNRPD